MDQKEFYSLIKFIGVYFVLLAALRLSLKFPGATKQLKNNFTLPLAMFMFVIKTSFIKTCVGALYNLLNICFAKRESTYNDRPRK